MKILLLIGCFLLGGILVGTGDYFSKRWALNGGSSLLISFIAYTLPLPVWFAIIKQVPQLARMTLMWSIVTTMAGCFVGLIIFKETFTTWNVVGAGLAIAALVLLSWR